MNRLIRLLNTSSALKWWIIFWIKYIISRRFRYSLQKNVNLRNSHKGERCFIVGNGPSLKEMDFSLLNNETVFTVNFLMKNQQLFYSIKPKYHVLVDPFFARMSKEELDDVLNKIKIVGARMILSYEVSNEIAPLLSGIEYYSVYMRDNWNRMGRKKIDMSKLMFSSQNVVQSAICMAIYMGFREIFLVGCEFTGIYESFEVNAGNKLVNKHAYDIKDQDQYKKMLCMDDNCKMLGEYFRVFSDFKMIQQYALSHNVSIVNATIGGILDVFPRINYFSCFENDK